MHFRRFAARCRLPTATLVLALVSLSSLVYQSALAADERDRFILRWAAVPFEITVSDLPPMLPVPIAATLFTSLFLHADWVHLASNLVYLWLFGPSLERAVGGGRLVGLYLLAGAGAGILQVFAAPTSMIPIIGASGALAGVMAAHSVLFPSVNARTMVFGGWCVLQLVQGAAAWDGSQQWTGGVAGWAHLGGLAVGATLGLLARQRGLGQNLPKQWHREQLVALIRMRIR